MTGWESELMGENGKQKAGPWHDLVIDVDNCCSLLDQSSGAVPSSPKPESIAGDFNFIFLDRTQQQEQKQQQQQQQQQKQQQQQRRQQRQAFFA